MLSQVCLLAAIVIHDVDFVVSISVGTKTNLFAIRRPSRVVVSRRIVGQPGLVTAIGIHQINLGVAIAP